MSGRTEGGIEGAHFHAAMFKARHRRCKLTLALFPAIPPRSEGTSMTGTTRTTEALDPRRRKLLFRSWHRGMREVDLILGAFADARIDSLTEQELDQYERLLETPDTMLFTWLTGQRALDDAPEPELMKTIVAFRSHNA